MGDSWDLNFGKAEQFLPLVDLLLECLTKFFDPPARKKRDKRVEIKGPKASNLIPLMTFSDSYNN